MASQSPKPPRNASVAVELLYTDHRNVEALFEEFEDQEESSERRETALRICKELTVHATVEEELFYPFLRENIDETDLVDEAEVEHSTARDLIAQIEAAEEVDDMFDAKVKVLQEYIKHHVKEEEEEIFPKLGDLLKDELDELGQEMHERKLTLMDEVGMLEAEGERASSSPESRAAREQELSQGARDRGE